MLASHLRSDSRSKEESDLGTLQPQEAETPSQTRTLSRVPALEDSAVTPHRTRGCGGCMLTESWAPVSGQHCPVDRQVQI